MRKNSKLSVEHRRKIGDALRGVKKSPEHNLKNSLSHIGKNKDKTYEQIYGERKG